MNTSTGTFISMDSYPGSIYDPVSLHKYLYANANPVMYKDPSGYYAVSLQEFLVTTACMSIVSGVIYYTAMEAISNLGDLLESIRYQTVVVDQRDWE